MKLLYEIVYHILIIIEGYVKLIIDFFKNSKSLRTLKRNTICNECKYRTSNGFCHLCGCYIKAKIRVNYPLDKNNKSIGGCPQKKW